MEENREEIDLCFKALNLDSRASQKEVELAYNVLTGDKNTPVNYIKSYRYAYEYLMSNVFNDFTEDNNEDDECLSEEEIYSSTVSVIPERVQNAFIAMEKITEEELTDKVKSLFATQIINLPLLTQAVEENCHKIFGIPFWTLSDMKKILDECCFNPIVFRNFTFNISFASIQLSNYTDELYEFVKSLKETTCNDKRLTKKFKIKRTKFGVVASVITEESLAFQIRNLLDAKARHIGCNLSLVSED